jgi:hypothetical protein
MSDIGNMVNKFMQARNKRPGSSAFYAAGNAVIAHLLGCKFELIRSEPTEHPDVFVYYKIFDVMKDTVRDTKKFIAASEIDAISAMAGPYADALYNSTAVDVDEWREDFKAAYQSLGKANIAKIDPNFVANVRYDEGVACIFPAAHYGGKKVQQRLLQIAKETEELVCKFEGIIAAVAKEIRAHPATVSVADIEKITRQRLAQTCTVTGLCQKTGTRIPHCRC